MAEAVNRSGGFMMTSISISGSCFVKLPNGSECFWKNGKEFLFIF
jgi:hypothetical protein